jgi:hypothetical protein
MYRNLNNQEHQILHLMILQVPVSVDQCKISWGPRIKDVHKGEVVFTVKLNVRTFFMLFSYINL